MPDLDLLQITYHTCTAVSSNLPGIIFKIPGQYRNSTTKFLEHRQSLRFTESLWHTHTHSYIWVLTTWHPTTGIPHPPLSLFLRNVDALTLWIQSVLGRVLREPHKCELCGKEYKLHLYLARCGCTCGECLPSLMLTLDVKDSNYRVLFRRKKMMCGKNFVKVY